jgi:hypothetical protein
MRCGRFKQKIPSACFCISHVFNVNRSRGWAESGDSKFIAWIADFANMSGQIFDLATMAPANRRPRLA